ncbi:MAG: lactoylglutathione lyase [Microvirga sp.]|nr:lactoylglutathione lyase [Microvirga sp.]
MQEATEAQRYPVAKAIHSMIRILDEQRSLAFYEKAFGLTVAERLAFEGFTLLYLSNPESEFELELTVPTSPKELKLDGRSLARFFFVQDPDGYKIEVLQRGGRYK